MTAAFAFFSSGSDADDSGSADTAPHRALLYRSEAFAEDLELMPAPQAVRRQTPSHGASAGGRSARWAGWLAAPDLAAA